MKTIFRAACFIAGLSFLIYIANTFFVTTDTLSYLTLDEMTRRDDAQIVFVGSSIARNHFVPDIIQENTTLVPFNLALPYMSMQGSIAASKLLFDHHDPQWMILVAEPYLFEATRESPQTQFRLMPFLDNLIDRFAYYLDLCMQDDRWLDRLLLPREYGVTSPEDFVKTLRHHTDVQHYYDAQVQTAQTVSIGSTYQGSGYMHPDFNVPQAQRLRIGAGRKPASDNLSIPEYSKQAIMRLAHLCEDNDTKLMVVIFPYITAAMLSTPDYLTYNELLEAFCEENGIPCFNFVMAKDTLMPTLDPYYQNVEHMSIDGAQLLSHAFSEVFTRYLSGEDVSPLFYSSRSEHLASINRVTNVWFEETTPGACRAASNHGTAVTPEYAFTAVAQDGSETILREYADDPAYAGEIPEGTVLRVYARVQENDSPAVYFDLY